MTVQDPERPTPGRTPSQVAEGVLIALTAVLAAVLAVPSLVAAARDGSLGVVSGSDDVLEAARVMRALDLVISVDSMPAHLAGALGVPVWTLLPHAADWRWMDAREDSPWYPTMRLFRQPAPGAWEPLIVRVASALGERAAHVTSS